jgi:hypothetical protein
MDDITLEQPAWFRALSRLKPALDTIRAKPLCDEIKRVELEIRDDAYSAIDRFDWATLARLADELAELSRFKELVCRR